VLGGVALDLMLCAQSDFATLHAFKAKSVAQAKPVAQPSHTAQRKCTQKLAHLNQKRYG